MKHVLVLDDDPQAHQRLRRSLDGARVCLEQATSVFAAYRRIAALPTLHVLILNVAHPHGREVEDFARRVIPAITVIPVGRWGDPAPSGRVSSPCRPCATWSAIAEDLARDLAHGDTPGPGAGQTTAGGWTA